MNEFYLVKYYGKHRVGFTEAAITKKEHAQKVFEDVVKVMEEVTQNKATTIEVDDNFTVAYVVFLGQDKVVDSMQVNISKVSVVDLTEEQEGEIDVDVN